MSTKSFQQPQTPVVPVVFSSYRDLAFSNNYVRYFADEDPIRSVEMTEPVFLSLCAICSPESAERFTHDFPSFRFFDDVNRLIPPDEYYGQIASLVAQIKSAYGLWHLRTTDDKTDISAHLTRLALYIDDHLQNLNSILQHYPATRGLLDYIYRDSQNPYTYLNFDTRLVEMGEMIELLKAQYLLIDQCATITEAMWRYGYMRIFVNFVEYKKCQKSGCDNYYAIGPGGQRGRKYCNIHLK